MATSVSMRRARPLLGTFVEIEGSTGAGTADGALGTAIDAAFDAVALVHRLMSFHDAQSDVSRLNREAFGGAVPVHRWTYQVLRTAQELHRRSAGLFDITVAPLLQRHGLLPGDADDCAERMNGAAGVELLADHRVRFRDCGIRLDLGGIAKGFAVDRALAVLRKHGLAHGLVNAGGDLAAFGPQPETIHVRDPRDGARLLCRVDVQEGALASSGRAFDPLRPTNAGECAVFDIRTQRPAREIAGATVRAPSCMIADALTKVVMLAGERSGGVLQHYRASALLVLDGGEVRVTPDWQDAIRLAA